MSDDLAEFLRDRLDDEVRVIQFNPSIRGEVDRQPITHTQAFRLAEIEAKRRIIAEHPATVERTGWTTEPTICDRCRYDDGLNTYVYPCPTLLLLALPYADHPDYRQEWRP